MKPLLSPGLIVKFAFFLLIPFFLACEQVPEGVFYEANGIISINARSLGTQTNWSARPYYTSVSMVSVEDATAGTGSLTFPFYIQTPGTYFLWTLTARNQKNPGDDAINGLILDENDFLLDSFQLELNKSNALRWMNRDEQSGEIISAKFNHPGIYKVIFHSGGHAGFVIDKIHLTLNNRYKPEGFGYPETNDPDQYPVVEKREQSVSIPPAWAFGVLYGGFTNQEEAMERVNRLYENDFPIDACWIDSPFANFDSQTFAELWDFMKERNTRSGFGVSDSVFSDDVQQFFESGLDFIKLDENAGLEAIQQAFEASQKYGIVENSRGFVLGSLQNIYNSDFKKFSAVLVNAQPNSLDFDQDIMRGLKENIEMVADPRLSTYEIPFLAYALGGGYDSFGASSISDELYIRWIQFSAFNSLMAVYSSPQNEKEDFPFDFSDLAQIQFKELSHLRNRLFPYIYSLAHLVRATGQKPVRGDGVHTTQFQLGDALLVAPVYEEGAAERIVNLPDGLWYDYWNRTLYEGGQEWTVEASLSKIPVFVKAGSIIPYRKYSQTILGGSNDSLMIEVYGGGNGTFRLYEDDGLTTDYRLGELATTAFRYFEGDGYSTFTIGSMVDGYEGQFPQKELQLVFKYADEPTKITANGEVFERGEGTNMWMYNQKRREIIANWLQPNYQKTDFQIDF